MQFCRLGSAIVAGAAMISAVPTGAVLASSHMDAPLITFDDAANTTDVYAFRSQGADGTQYLTTAVSVYPFEEPGIGPNNYRFDDNVLYEIHIAVGDKDVDRGRATLSYQFRFDTKRLNEDTVLQSFLGPIQEVFDQNQNLQQSYSVTKRDRRGRSKRGKKTVLGRDLSTPPNNQGLVTPFYNQGDDGRNPAKDGVRLVDGVLQGELDRYTQATVHEIDQDYEVFAGQRDDGFYADIQAIFDFDTSRAIPIDFTGPNKPFDSQGGFNVHTIVLNIPLAEFGDETIAGVYATTSRRRLEIRPNERDPIPVGSFVQVGRQGNPLKNEALVAIRDKDRYSVTPPTRDKQLFSQYAETVILAEALNLTPVVDIPGIFIPDVIKVRLDTGPARVPNDPRFDRLAGVLAVLGGNPDPAVDDVLVTEDDEVVFGGWPNGRRFGDDVVDVALFAIGLPTDLMPLDPVDNKPSADGVSRNDITYHDVFPYAATPLNGRNHPHHSETNLTN